MLSFSRLKEDKTLNFVYSDEKLDISAGGEINIFMKQQRGKV